MAKKKRKPAVDPDFLRKQKASLRRRHRQVIYFNEQEMAAIDEYCSRFSVSVRSKLFREAIIAKIMKELDDNHPTLF